MMYTLFQNIVYTNFKKVEFKSNEYVSSWWFGLGPCVKSSYDEGMPMQDA